MSILEVIPRYLVYSSGCLRKDAIASPKMESVGSRFHSMTDKMKMHLNALEMATTNVRKQGDLRNTGAIY